MPVRGGGGALAGGHHPDPDPDPDPGRLGQGHRVLGGGFAVGAAKIHIYHTLRGDSCHAVQF
jgi:hypothetical protein